MRPLRVAIAGGSGYVGGELLRLLLGHDGVQVVQVTSERLAGRPVREPHPNLRGWTDLRFARLDDLEDVDVLVLALPHGRAQERIEGLAQRAGRIIDCSADFRLGDAAEYARWYGREHAAPAWLPRFVYGLPEVERERIAGARFVSGVGCNATAVNLALLPLVRAGLVSGGTRVIAALSVGSSEGGRSPGPGSHHPERSGIVRAFAPVGHRHTAEVRRVHGLEDVHLSVTSVDIVRGAAAACHVFIEGEPGERELWRVWREATAGEPFLRVVHDRAGIHRHPEPGLLAGTNFADLGWAFDETTGRLVALCALDNLVKGAAGSAVQCLNLMAGFEEGAGLGFRGLHPS